jgi:hypothetical protein
MPRDGSLTLYDFHEPTIEIVCQRCGRHGRYNVKPLIAKHGAPTLGHWISVGNMVAMIDAVRHQRLRLENDRTSPRRGDICLR